MDIFTRKSKKMNEFDTVINEIVGAESYVDENSIDKLIKIITEHNRIFVFGTGRSGLMLKAFAMRLMQIGKVVYVVGETITPSIQEGDLLIVASASGETGSVVLMARSALKSDVDLFVVSASTESTLAKIHTPDIVIPSGTKYSTASNSVQPLGSLFEQMLLLLFDSSVMRLVNGEQNLDQEMASRHASLE